MVKKTSLQQVDDRLNPVQAHVCQPEGLCERRLDDLQIAHNVRVLSHFSLSLIVSAESLEQCLEAADSVNSGQKSLWNTSAE